jgi:serine/threonine-protein kinase
VTVIPEYEIHGLIKEGGMGQVYKAWNVSLQRYEAIKFIAPHLLASPEIRELFHREAVAVASLDHENIATLYRWGEAGGRPYLAFKYCDGGSLANRISGRQADREEIIRYALELAAGLEHAHNHGIIHRDIKPANILFHEGKLKLIDFGLSKYKEELRESSLTSGAGTPQYMSPDQVRGGPGDHRSDIYSFGVVLYEMAAGRRPFESENLQELLRQVSVVPPPPLLEERPDLGEAFCGLVHRMLAKDPADRPQSMTEVIERLRECGEEEAGEVSGRRAARRSGLKPLPERTTLLTPTPPSPAPLPAPVRIGVVVAAAVMAVVLLNPAAIMRVWRWSGGGPQAMPVIAILPFESVSKDTAAVEFCGALDARLAGELVQSVKSRGHFAVTPASEVRSYNIRSVAEARKRLNADFVFGGTVIRNEGGYEILLSLADASSQQQIKAETIRLERHSLDRFDATLRESALRMLPPTARAASVVVASAQAFSDPVAYELTVRAQGLLRQYTGQGPVDTALELLAQAVRLDPKSAEAHAWMAEARVQKWQGTRDQTHLELAEKSAAEALRHNPKLAAVRFAAGRTAQARGEWEKAIAEFNAAMAANPSDPEAFRFAGRVYMDFGRPKEAEAAYRKAVELSPNSWTSHTSLGAFYSRQQQWDEALKEFQRAADLYPESPLVHSNLGAAYYKLDRLEEAARAFETALQKRPNGYAYSNLGSVRFYQGRYADAAELFEHAVTQRPADAAAWCYLGEALARTPGNAARSREALQRSVDLFERELKVNRRSAETWSRMALAKAFLGDVRGARTAMSEALKLAPEDASVIYRAARTEARLGGTRDAAGHLLAALDKGYSTSEALREPGLEQARKDPRLRARFP